MSNKVTSIRFNYYPGSLDGQFPENFQERIAGQNEIKEILEHAACGEGDKWFYDIVYNDGSIERIFNPHQAFYIPLPSKTQ